EVLKIKPSFAAKARKIWVEKRVGDRFVSVKGDQAFDKALRTEHSRLQTLFASLEIVQKSLELRKVAHQCDDRYEILLGDAANCYLHKKGRARVYQARPLKVIFPLDYGFFFAGANF